MTLYLGSFIVVSIISSLFLAGAFGIYRSFVGPTQLDRVLALDYLSIVGIGVVILLVVVTGEPMVLDIGIGLALVGFLTAYVFAMFGPKE